jgi:hypothetical protein
MTPAKRRPATPAGKGPTRVAPDVPTSPPDAPVPDELVTAPGPPAEKKDSTELLGPDGEPIAEEAPTGDASGDSDPPRETGQVDDPEHRVTRQSRGRPLALYPLPVWPD